MGATVNVRFHVPTAEEEEKPRAEAEEEQQGRLPGSRGPGSWGVTIVGGWPGGITINEHNELFGGIPGL